MIAVAEKIVICFSHVAYSLQERFSASLQERFSALDTGINSFTVRDPATLVKRLGEADVLVISGLWQNRRLDQAKRLRFIQSIGAGTDQFPREELAKRGIRLVPLHRGFDGLLVVSAQGRQSGGVDEHFDAAGDARLSSDEPGALEREDHLVDRRRADMESALQIGFGRGATEHLSIGVDKG